jgi:hypothetical protein
MAAASRVIVDKLRSPRTFRGGARNVEESLTQTVLVKIRLKFDRFTHLRPARPANPRATYQSLWRFGFVEVLS